MQTKTFQLFITALLFGCSCNSLCAESSFVDRRADEIEAVLRRHLVEDAGIVVGLVDESGSRVFAAGTLGGGSQTPVDGDSIFELCSVTKVFTALLLLDADHRSELHMENPVADYLPQDVTLPEHSGQPITLAHLAAQESGLPFNPLPRQDGTPIDADRWTVAEMLASLGSYELAFKPGETFQYSNINFALLGHVLERTTGTNFESLVKQRICAPLGLKDTFVDPDDSVQGRTTRGHGLQGQLVAPLMLEAMGPGGELKSSCRDMLRFVSANLGLTDSPVNELLHQMQAIRHTGARRFGKTAMPWFDEGVYNPPGSNILAHGGGSRGYRSFVGFDTERRRGVVVLTNQTQFEIMGIGWTLLQDLPLSEHNITNWVREIEGMGFGLEMDAATTTPLITMVFEDTPASRQQLAPGDHILNINNTPTAGKPLAECLELMAGPIGKEVRLEVIDANDQRRMVTLRRQRILTSKS